MKTDHPLQQYKSSFATSKRISATSQLGAYSCSAGSASMASAVVAGLGGWNDRQGACKITRGSQGWESW